MHIKLLLIHSFLQDRLHTRHADATTQDLNLLNVSCSELGLFQCPLDGTFDPGEEPLTLFLKVLTSQLEGKCDVVGQLGDLHVNHSVSREDILDAAGFLVQALHGAWKCPYVRLTLPLLH